ncbi:MAG: alcohol dehydrogenase catalytic domain-containing protein [Propionibacterium sp.]|nr:alcohol dehydrogenase catalytic domain-containing protein [Propionibacterium sp.]
MVWRGVGPEATADFDITDLPLTPEEGDAVVQVDFATVCGSDRHTVEGRRPGACPSVLGHEAVGRLVRVPPGRLGVTGTELQVGDRVIWSVIAACAGPQRCDRCRAGLSAKCRNLRKTGHEALDSGWPLSGGYASHVVLPPGLAIAPVPASVDDLPAATAACAAATVMACRQAATDITPIGGQRVLIIGAGMLGLYAAAVSATGGAAEVVVVDPDPTRRGLAEQFGATSTAATADGALADVVFELSGAPSSVRAGLAALDVGGVLVLAGSVAPHGTIEVDPEQVVRRLITVRGVHNYEPPHLDEAVRFLADTDWPWHLVIGDPVPLAELPEVFARPVRPEVLRAGVRLSSGAR